MKKREMALRISTLECDNHDLKRKIGYLESSIEYLRIFKQQLLEHLNVEIKTEPERTILVPIKK